MIGLFVSRTGDSGVGGGTRNKFSELEEENTEGAGEPWGGKEPVEVPGEWSMNMIGEV